MAINDRDTTLGDLNSLDRDNFDHVMKKAKTYKFATPKMAQMFMGTCVDKAMRKCGVKINPSMDGNRIGRLMASKGVKTEHRVYDDKAEAERCNKKGGTPYQTGLYIYDNHEIAAFVSSPFKYQGKIMLTPAFYIRTTVKGVI